MRCGSAWLERPWPRPAAAARLRLLCLPYAGGTAAVFRAWPDLLDPAVDVVAVQYPGRASRFNETALRSTGAIVRGLADALPPLLDTPCVLFGHSMGGLLAYELAHELRRRRLPEPRHLIVSARRAPHLPLLRPPAFHLPHQAFVAELRAYEGTPEEVLADENLLTLLLPMLRADFAVSDLYRHVEREPLACGATVLGGTSDPHAPVDDLAPWRRHFIGDTTVHAFDAGHFYLHTRLDGLMARLNACLEPLLRG